mgnify:CR=1 FL=1
MTKHKVTKESFQVKVHNPEEDKIFSQQPLTFEQAILALDEEKDLYIDAPIDSLCHHLNGSVEREPMQEILLFMAEQKGWPVYICQGHDEA